MHHTSFVYKVKKLSFLLSLVVLTACAGDRKIEPAAYREASALMLKWNEFLLEMERHTPGYRPPVSARMFAYVGIAAYESALPELRGYFSLENHFPAYKKPTAGFSEFYLPASLNAAYAEIIHEFFPTAPPHLQEKLRLLELENAQHFEKKAPPEVLRRSANFGKQAALAVWRWSAADSLGHDAFLYNYDRDFAPPACPGCWQPGGEHPMPALLPYWGRVRSLVVEPESVPIRPPLTFDTHTDSPFYAEAMEVFSLSQPYSKENRWIAELWSDDLQGLTVTPAGRWIAIANQALRQAQIPFAQALECYLKTGLALSDAAVLCWRGKYHYNLGRPAQYIRAYIQPDWVPLHDTPSFPSYPSGHATFGAAAAEVLAAFLGSGFTLTDRTHEDRQEFTGKPRTYGSFYEMANENALSRIALGVHFRMDCEEGLRIGHVVGKKVVALPLHTDEVMAQER